MICTVEEAKTKWCPMIRNSNGGNYSDSVSRKNSFEGYCCISSNCMMWEYANSDNKKTGYCGISS